MIIYILYALGLVTTLGCTYLWIRQFKNLESAWFTMLIVCAFIPFLNLLAAIITLGGFVAFGMTNAINDYRKKLYDNFRLYEAKIEAKYNSLIKMEIDKGIYKTKYELEEALEAYMVMNKLSIK